MKPVKKPYKIGIIIAAIACVSFALTAMVVYYYFPIENIKSIVARQAEASLARKVAIGHIRYGIRGIHLSDVIVFDGLTDKDPLFAKIAECRLGIHLRSLLSLQMNFDFIDLERLSLDITFKNGISNIERFIDDYNKTPTTTKIDMVRLSGAQLTLKNAPESLKPLSGTYRISSTIDISKKNIITASDTILHLPENRGVIKTERMTISTKEGVFLLTSNLILEKCALPWVYGWKSGASLPFRTFDGTISDLTITTNDVKGKVTGRSLLSSGKILAVDGFCTVTFAKKHTLITSTEASMGNSTASVKLLSIPSSGTIDRLVVQKFSANLEDLQPLMSILPATVRGNVSGSFSFENGVVNADVKISGGAIGADGKIARNINETIQIANNSFRKENIPIVLFDTPFVLSIATKGNRFNSFIVNAHAKEMTIYEEFSKSSGIDTPIAEIPVDITGNLSIDKLFFEKYAFTGLKASFISSRKQLSFDAFTAKCFGGEISGKSVIDFSKNAVDIEAAITFEKIKVQQIAESSEKIKNRFFGTAQGRSEFAFRAGKDGEAMKTMKGKLEFTIANGKLMDTGLQNGLGAALSEMKYKLKDLEFSKISGNFSIAGSNYYVNQFEFIAPDVRLKLEGYFDKELDGDMKLSLEFNINFIQDVPNPALLQLNKYKQGGWYIIPFAMKGNITKSENYRRLK